MIYLDQAATTAVDPRVRAVLLEALADPLNASSVHRHGQRARRLLEQAREQMGALLGVPPQEVVFTSGASESNNLAIRGLAAAAAREGRHLRVLSSPLEHACIRETVGRLAGTGTIEASSLDVTPEGKVVIPDANGPRAGDLLCMMAVQNETGVVQPLDAARDQARSAGCLWLCDAVQAFGMMDVRVPALGASFLSLSSHKIYGPPGVGLLAGPGVSHIESQITGGPQENEHRAGTQPVALIRAFVHAARLAVEERDQRRRHVQQLTQLLVARLRDSIGDLQVNGEDALPGFLNVSFPGVSGADLVIALDSAGFSVSSGSACATGVMETSPALEAMFPADASRAASAIRITPGKDTTEEEVGSFAEVLIGIVHAARTAGARTK